MEEQKKKTIKGLNAKLETSKYWKKKMKKKTLHKICLSDGTFLDMTSKVLVTEANIECCDVTSNYKASV